MHLNPNLSILHLLSYSKHFTNIHFPIRTEKIYKYTLRSKGPLSPRSGQECLPFGRRYRSVCSRTRKPPQPPCTELFLFPHSPPLTTAHLPGLLIYLYICTLLCTLLLSELLVKLAKLYFVASVLKQIYVIDVDVIDFFFSFDLFSHRYVSQ